MDSFRDARWPVHSKCSDLSNTSYFLGDKKDYDLGENRKKKNERKRETDQLVPEKQ